MNQDLVRFAVAGLGGYANNITTLLTQMERTPDRVLRLTAVCDPSPDLRAAFANAHPDISVYESFEQMIAAGGFDALWLPVPIHLHRPFAEAALAAGYAVVVEKPVAGSIDDFDAMDAAARRAGRPLLVGFQDVYDPVLFALRQRLRGGLIGTIRHASVMAHWPRTDGYYARNNWAGAVKRNDTWVMDSPLANAVAHPVNTALWLMAAEGEETAEPLQLSAELYRARPIENFDTVAARVSLEGGATMQILLTHACETFYGPLIRITGDSGTVEVENNGDHYFINGEKFSRDPNKMARMAEACAAHIAGRPLPDRSVATLELSRAHMLINNGVAIASPVHEVKPTIKGEQGDLKTIAGIEQVFADCVESRLLPSEMSLPWTRPAGEIDLHGFDHFPGPRTA